MSLKSIIENAAIEQVYNDVFEQKQCSININIYPQHLDRFVNFQVNITYNTGESVQKNYSIDKPSDLIAVGTEIKKLIKK